MKVINWENLSTRDEVDNMIAAIARAIAIWARRGFVPSKRKIDSFARLLEMRAALSEYEADSLRWLDGIGK